jgi:hypothetical protein
MLLRSVLALLLLLLLLWLLGTSNLLLRSFLAALMVVSEGDEFYAIRGEGNPRHNPKLQVECSVGAISRKKQKATRSGTFARSTVDR